MDDGLPQYIWDPGATRVVYEDDRKRNKEQAKWIQRRWDERKERRELEKNTGPANGAGNATKAVMMERNPYERAASTQNPWVGLGWLGVLITLGVMWFK